MKQAAESTTFNFKAMNYHKTAFSLSESEVISILVSMCWWRQSWPCVFSWAAAATSGHKEETHLWCTEVVGEQVTTKGIVNYLSSICCLHPKNWLRFYVEKAKKSHCQVMRLFLLSLPQLMIRFMLFSDFLDDLSHNLCHLSRLWNGTILGLDHFRREKDWINNVQ